MYHTVEEIKKLGATGAVIMDELNYWHSSIEQKDPEFLAQEIKDTVECIIDVFEESNESSVSELRVFLTVGEDKIITF